MNFKSNILKILVVFALILMLVPVIAAEDVADDSDAVAETESVDEVAEDAVVSEAVNDSEEEVAAAEPAAAGGAEDALLGYPVPVASGFLMDLPAADLAVKVTPEYQTVKAGDLVMWAASFANLGPDTAENVIGRVSILEGNIAFIDAFATYFNPLTMTEPVKVPDAVLASSFDPVTGLFDIGELELGDIVTLYIIGQALDDGEAIFGAAVSSDTYDPDLSNNVAFGYVNYAGEAAAAEETLPATGNPIAMALLALISIAGVAVGRKL